MNKQAVLDVLNSLEVIETNGGEDAYILVANSEENRMKLNAVGVTDETITRYGDDETFCILALAFNEGYADEYRDGKLVLWGPIDDELRYRVLNGEGTPADAERLLRELEPGLFSFKAMKYFEIHDPYYALIKAADQEEAIKIYTEYVADDEDGTLHEEIEEVDRDYALIQFARSESEDRDFMPVPETLEKFRRDKSEVLLIDSGLL